VLEGVGEAGEQLSLDAGAGQRRLAQAVGGQPLRQ
jgi:hypothetical protein